MIILGGEVGCVTCIDCMMLLCALFLLGSLFGHGAVISGLLSLEN